MPTDLHYRLTGDSTALERAMHRGTFAMTKAGREARRLEAEQRRLHNAMSTVGKGMLLAGAAVAAGLALSVRAAVEWESAWAGVLKTVEGSPEQMAALEEEIRSLTGVLPATHREIAAVAEAAGQLGIQRQNVAAFTRTMIDMGEATNLSSEEAATSIARFMNIMQTAPQNVGRLAAAIVDLGNKGATTESEITEMALRIAGAGRTIGLSEQQVLGFAAALSNVGIRAEAGGTAISKVFLEIDSAVSAGGDNLEVFAQTAGMTADQFRQAYEQDAGAAIAAFVAGLARVQSSGGDVNAVLAELGLTEIRVSDALRRLAGSGTNLATALDLSNRAWDENTALLEEAERRYGTTAAQTAIARNQVNDFAIDIGNGLLPVVRDAVGTFAAMTDILTGLPGPVKSVLGVVAGLTAVVLLLGGAYLLAVPRIIAAKVALDTWALSAARGAGAARGMGAALGFLAGPWGLAIAAAATVATIAFAGFAKSQAQARAEIRDMVDTLDEETGAITLNTRAKVLNQLETDGVAEKAAQLGIDMNTLVDAALGEAAALEVVAAATAEVNAEQDAMMGEHVFVRTKGLSDELQHQSDVVTGAQEVWRRQKELMDTTTVSAEELAPATRDLATAFDASAASAEDVADAVDDLDEELKQLFDRVFGLQNAQDDLADAFDALTEKIQEQKDAGVEGAGSLEGMSEAARENRDLTQELLEKFGALTLETIRSTGSQEEAEAAAKTFKERLEDLAEQTGTNVEDLEGYNDVVAEIERLIEVTFQTPGVTAAEAAAERLRRKLANIDRTVTISFQTQGFAPVGSIRIPGQQTGGPVLGTPGPDRVLRMLTHGEHVWTVREVQAAGGHQAVEALRAAALGGQATRFAISGSDAAMLGRAKPGYVLAEDGSWVPRNFFATAVAKVTMPKPGFVQAEDGSWVPKAFSDAKKRNPAENPSRTGPRGPRTWDFYTSNGRSYARIFATGELIALGKMHEDHAFTHLKKIGKLDGGGWLPPGVSIVENATGQPERVLPPGGPWQWHGARPAGGGLGGMAGGGAFTGQLYLDSGELLGVVRGEIRQSQSQHDRDLLRRTGQGVGAAR